MENNNEWRDATEKRLDKAEVKIDGLVAFRNWLVGAAALISFVVGMFADRIKHLFGG